MKRRHLRTGCTYEVTPDGLILVEDESKGISGLFNPDGTWQSGDLRFADNHMIEFVVGAAAHAPAPAGTGSAS